MSVKMSERDLEALRAGITQQAEKDVRDQLFKADFEREFAKRHVRQARVIEARKLRVGDAICSTHGYRFFKEEMRVCEIRFLKEEMGVREIHYGHNGAHEPVAGDLWVVFDSNGGGGGFALRNDDPVLVEIRPEATHQGGGMTE